VFDRLNDKLESQKESYKKEFFINSAIIAKVCPDCGGDLVIKKSLKDILREVFLFKRHYECSSCKKIHAIEIDPVIY
jgi:hypothetical protein